MRLTDVQEYSDEDIERRLLFAARLGGREKLNPWLKEEYDELVAERLRRVENTCGAGV